MKSPGRATSGAALRDLLPARAPVSAAGSLILLLVGLSGAACGPQETVRRVEAPEAYSDGFEVVVIPLDADASAARSVELEEAYELTGSGAASFWMPPGAAEDVAGALQGVGPGGDFRVDVEVQEAGPDRQRVTTSFHYGMRTYRYCYEVDGETVIPVWSRYADLKRATRTEYGNEVTGRAVGG